MTAASNEMSDSPTDRYTRTAKRAAASARERALARTAARQHGVVALAQLHGFGWSTSAVEDRVASGRLHRVHRATYAVGHRRLSRRGLWMAAVLACGPGALLSHRSAAELQSLLRRSPRTVEVATPSRIRHRPGIRPHLITDLTDADRDVVDAIPCLSVPRLLLIIAATEPRELPAAIAAAERHTLLHQPAVEELLERCEHRPGAPALRAAIAALAIETTWTRSELERRFLELCLEAGLARPRVNAWLTVPGGGFEVDFSWTALGLAVEADGYETHRDRRAFEEDRRRDQALTAAGWTVLRFTWRQVKREPELVAATLRRLSASRREASARR